MTQFARVIGGAGTGKTTHLLQIMEKVIDTGEVHPLQIGFVSFTRAAREEAAKRAGRIFKIPEATLTDKGWFKTLHAACYRQLGVGKSLLTWNKKDKEWLSNALESKIRGLSKEEFPEPFERAYDAETAIQIWDCSRNMLVPFREVWKRAASCDERTPGLEYCERIVERYETHKSLDNRCDFTDLLGRYAGISFKLTGPVFVNPQGEVPSVPVWFLDECQDNSALTDAVAKRLVSKARWVYLVGDPFQAIYGWSGASSKHFMSWDVPPEKQRILQKTRRCPAPITELGERIISRCSDYFDRGIQPADHPGSIERISYQSPFSGLVNANESWLLIARTNFLASKLVKRIDSMGIPWLPTREGTGCRWDAPIRNAALKAMAILELGEHARIKLSDWQKIIKFLPSKENLVKGAKKEWSDYDGPDYEIKIGDLIDHGATETLIQKIKNRKWRAEVPFATEYIEALHNYGEPVVNEPRIKIGTIHSVKGAEADNVLLLSTVSHQVNRSQEDQEGSDEERRVEYVAVTRARKRLFIATDSTAKFHMNI